MSVDLRSPTIALEKEIPVFHEYLLHGLQKFSLVTSVSHENQEVSAQILFGFIFTRGPISNDIRTDEVEVGHLGRFPR